MWLLKDELVHFSLAFLVGLFFALKNRDWRLILPALAVGFFVDADHLIDYFLHFGPKFVLQDFLNVTTYMGGSEKVYILFHGWEWLVILFLAGKYLENKWKIKNLPLVLILAYFAHLIWDQYTASPHPLGYFFTFRLLNRFDLIEYDVYWLNSY